MARILPIAPVRVTTTMRDGQMCPSTTVDGAAHPPEGRTVYEVVRVHAGRPVFWAEHKARLYSSGQQAGVAIPAPDVWEEAFLAMVRLQTGTQNVLLRAVGLETRPEAHIEAAFIESHYPGEADYREGVPLGLLESERSTPNAKVLNADLRARANAAISRGGVHEVLLVNRKGHITEGSRSNVFFAQGERLITPPLHQVLGGITRLKVLEVARRLGVEVLEAEVAVEELSKFDGVAMTGTSPGVLPVRSVAQHQYAVPSRLIDAIGQGYDALMYAE